MCHDAILLQGQVGAIIIILRPANMTFSWPWMSGGENVVIACVLSMVPILGRVGHYRLTDWAGA